MARTVRNVPVPRGKEPFEAEERDAYSRGPLYRAGLYLRLSREDGGRKSSHTIENQRELLLRYVASREDMEPAEIYIDNGCSGTDFAEVR